MYQKFPNIIDLAKAVCKNCKIKYVGIRPGEKLHEDLITITDSPNTYDIGPYYAILMKDFKKLISYYKEKKQKKLKVILVTIQKIIKIFNCR